MATDTDRLLWPEEVAEMCGIEPRSVIFYASQRRRHERAEQAAGEPAGTRTAYDIPAPAGRERRVVRTQEGAPRTVVSPQWREAEITAWREALAARPAPARSHEPGTGRFKAAS
jgi:hypothetical protein